MLSWIVTAAWSAAAALFAWYAAGVAQTITYVTLADGRRAERRLPLSFKLLLPLAPNLKPMMAGQGMAAQRERADARLVTGGFEGLLSGWEFLSLKLLLPLCFGTLWILLIHSAARVSPVLAAAALPLDLLGLALLYLQPSLWLRKAVATRQRAILRSLPFVLDLLTLSVEAGMDFISALQRNCQSRKLDALNEELLRMTKEIQVGLSRREALKNMADRVRQSDLRSVAFALIQADELGVSIGAILRIQSEQLRSRRFDRAEKLAHEAPTKMLGPLMLCIFPAVFIILLGPVLSQAMKGML
jgi:tight adherence protein C